MQFLRYKKLEGKIKLLSGLHIGGNKDNIEIGGIDNPVVKNHITGLPYIPGSSIKGKMRFFLEWKLEKKLDLKNGEPHSCKEQDCPICRIFGNTDKDKKYGPTRLSVRDCDLILSKEEEEKLENNELNILEDKVENRINRLTGSAIDPRHIERVVPGTFFKFELIYKIFEIETDENNKDEEFWDEVLNALYYLQEDALGGSGSRGYGKFEFDDLKLDGTGVNLEWDGTKAILKEKINKV